MVIWIAFAIFICIFVAVHAQRQQLNKRVQDLLDSDPLESYDVREEGHDQLESNVIRIDPRTGTYRKM